ncbi:MAG TPA: hypothetical protein VIV60_24450, partial [Polyangiaceae bacterium]
MRTAIFVLIGLVSACGPSYTQTVKSPDDLLAEQEALGAEQQKKSKENSDFSTAAPGETDSEQAEKFDEVYTERE